MARQFRPVAMHLDRRVHRAAARMPQHDEQRDFQNRRAVFDAGDIVFIADIAGDPADEDVTRPWLKTSSGSTRESAQDRNIAIGVCPPARPARPAPYPRTDALSAR